MTEDKLIRKLEEIKTYIGNYYLEKYYMPCTDRQILQIKREIKEALNYDADAGYLRLLEIMNGFTYSGYSIYPGKDVDDKDTLVAMNQIWNEGLPKVVPDLFIVFGHCDLDFFVKDLTTGTFKVMNTLLETTYEEFTTFEDLVGYIVDTAINS